MKAHYHFCVQCRQWFECFETWADKMQTFPCWRETRGRCDTCTAMVSK
jgi:hypothetical protein